MTPDNFFIRLVFDAATQDPCSRAIYRPRSKQLFQYLAHASKPHEKKDEGGSGEPDSSNADEQRAEDERRYIDTRLKEIAAWERKIRNGKM